jgi:predicted metal-binding protein
VDFDDPTLQLANVTHAFQVTRKHDNCERACAVVFAEIEVVHPVISVLNPDDFASDATCFPNMILGFVDGNALSSEVWEEERQRGEKCSQRHSMIYSEGGPSND